MIGSEPIWIPKKPRGLVLHLGISDGEDVIESSHAPGCGTSPTAIHSFCGSENVRWFMTLIPPRYSKTANCNLQHKINNQTQPSSTMISMAAKPSSKPSFSCFLAAFCSRDLPVALRLLACEASGLHRRRSGFAGHQLRFGCASLGSCFLTFLTYFGSKSHHSSGQDQVESRGRSRNRTLFAVQCQCHGHDDSTHGIFQYWSWCLNMRIHIMYIHVNIYIVMHVCIDVKHMRIQYKQYILCGDIYRDYINVYSCIYIYCKKYIYICMCVHYVYIYTW